MFKYLLPLFLAAGMLFFGYQAYQESKPSDKNSRLYSELKPYIPYKIEKRIGGLSIVSSENDIKEKPPASKVFKRLEQLEQLWAKSHLVLEGDSLRVIDENNNTLKVITLQNQEEKTWIKSYFGL